MNGKNGKGGDENLKSFFLVWLKLKIETKMRKYVSKIKTVKHIFFLFVYITIKLVNCFYSMSSIIF
jgi:hypothetical protein